MRALVLPVLLLLLVPCLRAQDNYEIQVYSYDTVAPHHAMVELHSNFTIDGSKSIQDGILPTNHALHETIEITHGFTDWFETGFYIFTYERNGNGIQIRLLAPEHETSNVAIHLRVWIRPKKFNECPIVASRSCREGIEHR